MLSYSLSIHFRKRDGGLEFDQRLIAGAQATCPPAAFLLDFDDCPVGQSQPVSHPRAEIGDGNESTDQILTCRRLAIERTAAAPVRAGTQWFACRRLIPWQRPASRRSAPRRRARNHAARPARRNQPSRDRASTWCEVSRFGMRLPRVERPVVIEILHRGFALVDEFHRIFRRILLDVLLVYQC